MLLYNVHRTYTLLWCNQCAFALIYETFFFSSILWAFFPSCQSAPPIDCHWQCKKKKLYAHYFELEREKVKCSQKCEARKRTGPADSWSHKSMTVITSAVLRCGSIPSNNNGTRMERENRKHGHKMKRASKFDGCEVRQAMRLIQPKITSQCNYRHNATCGRFYCFNSRFCFYLVC